MGHTPEEFDQIVAKTAEGLAPQEPMTEEGAAAALAALAKIAAGIDLPEIEEDVPGRPKP